MIKLKHERCSSIPLLMVMLLGDQTSLRCMLKDPIWAVAPQEIITQSNIFSLLHSLMMPPNTVMWLLPKMS